MALIISDDVLNQANISAEKLLVDLATYLYETKKLSMGQARKLAKMDQLSFQKALAERDIYIHYDEHDLAIDLKNLGIEL
ncbi:MAG: UPF0175 family protein [Bacteroidia bacterium]